MIDELHMHDEWQKEGKGRGARRNKKAWRRVTRREREARRRRRARARRLSGDVKGARREIKWMAAAESAASDEKHEERKGKEERRGE